MFEAEAAKIDFVSYEADDGLEGVKDLCEKEIADEMMITKTYKNLPFKCDELK
jgi:hypothetical protein